MNRSLSRRVARAEAWGRCPACKGLGEGCLVVWVEGEPKPEPRGCARCGRVGEATTLIFGTAQENLEEAGPGTPAAGG